MQQDAFRSVEWGIRAIMRILLTYRDMYRLHTVRGIIERWAPPTENDTGSYVQNVARRVGVLPDAAINLDHVETARDLIAAIIQHENGMVPYDQSVIPAGIALARHGS